MELVARVLAHCGQRFARSKTLAEVVIHCRWQVPRPWLALVIILGQHPRIEWIGFATARKRFGPVIRLLWVHNTHAKACRWLGAAARSCRVRGARASGQGVRAARHAGDRAGSSAGAAARRAVRMMGGVLEFCDVWLRRCSSSCTSTVRVATCCISASTSNCTLAGVANQSAAGMPSGAGGRSLSMASA